MAHYTINHTCGHTDRVQLYGSHKARYAEIARRESCVCPDCYRAEQQAAAQTLTASLPPMPSLTGSDKQIAWAETIRANLACEMRDIVDRAPEATRDQAQACYDHVVAHTDASWWIDNRDYRAIDLLRDEIAQK